MNPADRLIVALDMPNDDAFDLIRKLRYQASFYKMRARSFLERNGLDLAQYIIDNGNKLFLDFKLYDTPDSIKGDVEKAVELNATFLSVYKRSVAAAMEARISPVILAVSSLTSDGPALGKLDSAFNLSDGIICHPSSAKFYRMAYPSSTIVCPGVRMAQGDTNNHLHPITPKEAIVNGADYIVVGRPIYEAIDPVAAVREITKSLKGD